MAEPQDQMETISLQERVGGACTDRQEITPDFTGVARNVRLIYRASNVTRIPVAFLLYA